MSKIEELERDLSAVINKHGLDSQVGIPDFLIAEFIVTTIAGLKTLNAKNECIKDS